MLEIIGCDDDRAHGSLGYLSPVAFEQAWWTNQGENTDQKARGRIAAMIKYAGQTTE